MRRGGFGLDVNLYNHWKTLSGALTPPNVQSIFKISFFNIFRCLTLYERNLRNGNFQHKLFSFPDVKVTSL
jgi:hypothetical protein